MGTKTSQAEDSLKERSLDIVVWDPKYVTGITLIDGQHKELVALTNDLYHACLEGKETAGAAFKETMSRMVKYVRFHFGSEQELLQKIRYPLYAEHKKKHEELVRTILEAAKGFDKGQKFVPNNFVRILKDWIFSHIAIEDQRYALYAAGQKKKGLLLDLEIDAK